MSVSLIRFWERNRDRCSLAAAIALSLLLMAADQSPPILSLKKGMINVLGVFEEGISWVPKSFALREKYRQSMVKASKYSIQHEQYQEVLLENRRLRRLLGFKERNTFDLIPADVIGMGTAGIPGAVHLNVGWEEGCRKNMVLMTDRGVVGKLLSVTQSRSVGQLLSDPNFRISAKVQRSRVLGIVRWLYGNVYLLEGVSQRSDVRLGDLVVTSGYSQIYPSGLAIGRVFEVSPGEKGLFQRVYLRTEVDLGALEELLILKNNLPL